MESENLVVNAQPELPGIIDGTKSYMYEELWKMCAGPLCDLPKIGEKVVYFPQGNIELVESSTRDKLNPLQPDFILPSKLQCRVTAIKLEAEKNSDQVYAEITLTTDTTQFNETTSNQTKKAVVKSFTKVLTPSDISIHGGFSVPIKHATECLPALNMSQPVPTQDLLAKDLHGNEWRFKHSFRGTPRRHLITTGWSTFLRKKELVCGDVFVFLRGESGGLKVGVRRAGDQQGIIDSSMISPEAMRHGIIASAIKAFDEKCVFNVIYKPRSSRYVVGYEKFIDAVNNKFHIGSRYTMRFEADDLSERSYSGTIIGVDNFSPHWKDSEWRSLQVKWDEFASFPRPDKVSPWEIEHLISPSNIFQSSLLTNKRSKHDYEIGSTSSSHLLPPLVLTQGQEIGQPSMTSPNNLVEDANTPYDAGGSCRLFGVTLAIPSPMISESSKLGMTQTLASPREIQSQQFSSSTRSFTKVKMQGAAIGRALDLSVLNGYDQLKRELERIFDINGQLQTRNQWEIVFTDNEGDMMLVGDDPWPEFCKMVKKIFICSKEEVKNLKLGNSLSN